MYFLYPSPLENIKLLYKKRGIKQSKETCEKKRQAILGIKRTTKTKEKLSKSKIGNKNSLGTKRTPESKEKQKQSAIKRYENPKEREKISLIHLNKPKSKEHKEKLKQAHLGTHVTQITKEKIRQGHLHIFSALDKLIKNKYCILWTEELKETIRKRDKYICQNCGKPQTQEYRKLTVHHIHYLKSDCYPDLITLCNSCNIKANTNRNYWEQLFMNKLNDRQLLFWIRDKK